MFLCEKSTPSFKQMAVQKHSGLYYYEGAGALKWKARSFLLAWFPYSLLSGSRAIKSVLPKDVCSSL